MQAELPLMSEHHQEPGASLQQLRATAVRLQPKLQAAMQQATCSGVTCSTASGALPDLAVTPVLLRLQRHVMSTQTAPHHGMHSIFPTVGACPMSWRLQLCMCPWSMLLANHDPLLPMNCGFAVCIELVVPGTL